MKPAPQRLLIDVSWRALLKLVLLGLGLFLTYELRDIIIMLLIVFIFVAAVNPSIIYLQRHMSRSLAVTLFYAVVLGVVALIFLLFVPRLIHQINDLIHFIPALVERVQPYLHSSSTAKYASLLNQALDSLTGSLQHISGNFLDTTITFVGGLATAITGVVISFYLLLEEKNAREFFHQVLPQNRFEAVYHTVSEISERMGSWVRGQLLLMVIIGASNLVLFIILGIPSPLPLAIWAGLAEVIPIVGSTLGILPAIGVALVGGSVLKAVLVVALSYGLIQQVEAHFIVPRLIGRAVGLSPVLVILALLIGIKLFGFIGALVGVPAAAVVSVVVGEWTRLRQIWEEEEFE